MSNDSGVDAVSLLRVSKSDTERRPDLIAVEEPLEIRIAFGPMEDRTLRRLAVTMRTPGHDFELAVGFLLAEGLITRASDVVSIRHCSGRLKPASNENEEDKAGNTVRIELDPSLSVDLTTVERYSFISSSCGACGKTSIEAVKNRLFQPVEQEGPFFNRDVICSLPDSLARMQTIFSRTGGLHATGIFNSDGDLLLAREDVGRHNAMDKVFGAALHAGWLPLSEHIICLSGRVSFELVQKALAAGVSVVAAVGAPSSLAVDLATEFDLSLLGFVKEQGFNVYSGQHRLQTN